MNVARGMTVLFGLAGPLVLASLAACGARTGLWLFPDEDASTDALPIEDVVLPGLDSQAIDVPRAPSCVEAGDTLIYTVTTNTSSATQSDYRLLRFDPASSTFTLIGTLDCPDQGQPFSMAVDRTGAAYVLYYNEVLEGEGEVPSPGTIYRVDLNNAACQKTDYVPSTQFQNFGMAFSADETGGGETLYVASNNNDTTGSGFLGAIDESTLALTYVGTFSPPVMQAELTGTGDGRLYAFWAPSTSTNPGSAVAQIDKTNATVVAQALLPTVTQGGGWAFAFWGGDFYLFTNPDGPTTGDPTTIVQRYDPSTGTVVKVASYPETVVGAGVDLRARELSVGPAGGAAGGGARAGGGLAGKRILVTRARAQGEKTAALVRARGGEAVLLPAIELHPPRDLDAVRSAIARARAGSYGWVAFTSENGVEHTWRVLEERRPPGEAAGSKPFGGAKLAAIGPKTAAALEARGARADVVATESTGEGLAAAVLAAMKPGESLLLFRAQAGRDAFPDALARAGHSVDPVAVYETRPASGAGVAKAAADLEADLGRGAIDAAMFTSASTVESFCAMVGGQARAQALLARTVVGSIGPITSAALAASGIQVDAVAADATLEGLLCVLDARLAARTGFKSPT